MTAVTITEAAAASIGDRGTTVTVARSQDPQAKPGEGLTLLEQLATCSTVKRWYNNSKLATCTVILMVRTRVYIE